MGDEVEELQARIDQLTEENEQLAAQVEQLQAGSQNKTPIKWQRGKLPGEKLIKTDPATGKFELIDRAEWDSLA